MTTRPGYVWDATASEWVEIGQAAVLAPIKYQTSQPSSPATGDIWIDSDDEVPSVDSTLYYRWTKTMSGGETSLSGTDNNSLALKYTPGYESVFINGVLQVRGSDYVATTGTTVTGLTALTASDVVMVESIVAYSVGDTYTQSTLDGKFSPITTTGMVLLNETNFSAASTINLNNVFNSSYSNYRVICNVTAVSVNDQNINLRLRVGGTDNSTASSYQRSLLRVINGSVSSSQLSDNYTLFGQTNTTVGCIITADFFNPFATAPTKFVGNFHAGGSGTEAWYLANIGCYHTQSTSYDGFSLLPASGTITGTIKVYGYK